MSFDFVHTLGRQITTVLHSFLHIADLIYSTLFWRIEHTLLDLPHLNEMSVYMRLL